MALIEAGVAVEFAPETYVLADMPVTLGQAASQNARWERGRVQLIRQYVPRLIAQGLRRRSVVFLDAAAEQLIPPLSVPFAIAVVATLAALLLGRSGLAEVAAMCLGSYVAYVAVALALVRAPLRIYFTLILAPVYVVWKVGLYAGSLRRRRGLAWVRTARTPTASASS
jgi:hypothetical protein